MGWTVSYELHRDTPLTDEEREWLGAWDGENDFLRHAPEPNVLASGFTKMPWEPDHDDWQRVLVAVTELRTRFPDAKCEVSDTYENVYWDEEIEAYSNGLRDGLVGAHDIGEDDPDEELEDEEERAEDQPLGEPRGFELLRPVEEPAVVARLSRVQGRLELTHDAPKGPISAALNVVLEGGDLTLHIDVTKSNKRMQVECITLVARAADGAPCHAATLGGPGFGYRGRVEQDFASIVTSFELFAHVCYDIDELIASYDAKASVANKSPEPLVLDPRRSPPGIGLEIASILGWTVCEFERQEIVLFPRVKTADSLVPKLGLACKLLDATGAELERADGWNFHPIDLVRASRSPIPVNAVEALRRIEIFAKGRIEGEVPLGRFRIVGRAGS